MTYDIWTSVFVKCRDDTGQKQRKRKERKGKERTQQLKDSRQKNEGSSCQQKETKFHDLHIEQTFQASITSKILMYLSLSPIWTYFPKRFNWLYLPVFLRSTSSSPLLPLGSSYSN